MRCKPSIHFSVTHEDVCPMQHEAAGGEARQTKSVNLLERSRGCVVMACMSRRAPCGEMKPMSEANHKWWGGAANAPQPVAQKYACSVDLEKPIQEFDKNSSGHLDMLPRACRSHSQAYIFMQCGTGKPLMEFGKNASEHI